MMEMFCAANAAKLCLGSAKSGRDKGTAMRFTKACGRAHADAKRE